MLLKSTGSLRRKRAENSPVCRKGNGGKELHEWRTCRSYAEQTKIAHVKTRNMVKQNKNRVLIGLVSI